MDIDKLRRGERTLLLVLWAAVVLFGLLLVAASWPEYWRYVAAETTPLAWLESLLLLLTACTAAFVALLESLREPAAREIGWSVPGWIVLAAAFAWLALDERFAVHERVRDRYLQSTGIKVLPWMEAGDWLIPIYFVCGLAAAWGIWRLLGARKAARGFFVAGIVVAACAVSLDTIDIRSLAKGTERLLQSIEEGLETTAMTCFLSAFLTIWTEKLRALTDKGGS